MVNSIIVFGLFFIFFIYGASAKVQQIASVPLPVHQSVSQAFSWGSEFYVATRTIGITIPYSGSCNLYRFTSGGLLTGTLNLLNITVASYSDDGCTICSYGFSSQSTVTLLLNSYLSSLLVDIDLPSWRILAWGKPFFGSSPALIPSPPASVSLFASDTNGKASLYSLDFPAQPFPSKSPLLQLPLSMVRAGIALQAGYLIGFSGSSPYSTQIPVLFNQSLPSTNSSSFTPICTLMSGRTSMAALTPKGLIVSTTEVVSSTDGSYTTFLNIFPSWLPFPDSPSQTVVQKNNINRVSGILADDDVIFVFMSSGGPSTLFQYARSTKHPYTYDFVQQQSIGPARLGADMLSGALMSSSKTFVCAAVQSASDSSQVAFYTY